MLSVLQVGSHRVDGETRDRQQLLALRRLRRGLEPSATHGRYDQTVAPMTERAIAKDPGCAATVRRLQELIAALDRRVPQVERAGEAAIARAAAALRAEAVKRIRELERG